MSSPSKRREMDVMKLMMSDYKVEMVNDAMGEFYVEFHGPRDSSYQEGTWKVHVELPESYPFTPPTIGFENRIFHPNVDEISGLICLDVLNEKWSPMFDLMNVFEIFLPQLLLYPNAAHGLNDEALALLIRDPKLFEQKVKEHCESHAKLEDIASLAQEDEDTSDGEVSEDDEQYTSSSDNQMASHADP